MNGTSKDDSSLREAFTDATYFKDEALRAFKLGVLGLEERAQVGLSDVMHPSGVVHRPPSLPPPYPPPNPTPTPTP
jgi:hypothetical protein